MAINKVVYDGDVLIDLTSDTVTAKALKKGYTAHGADGELITGTLESDSIEYILASGLDDGVKNISDDGTIITTTDSSGRTLTKTFSNNFLTSTSVLTDENGDELGTLVKKLSYNSSKCETTLYDGDGNIVSTQVKTFSSDYKKITTTVTYEE